VLTNHFSSIKIRVDDSKTNQRDKKGRGEMYPELMKLKAYKRLSTKDLAKIVGITQQSMSRKLNGASEFKRTEMQKIKEYFQRDFPEIIMDQIFTEDIFLPERFQNESGQGEEN